ncbi:MAG: carbohydrate ABC transporter permease [Phycisphaerae bacterium]|nr:carbohydrate ABC transporter permease [Phycisphaerae bacterium]
MTARESYFNPSSRSTAKSLIRLIVLALIAMVMGLPFFWMVLTSLKPFAEAEQTHLIPKQLQRDNYSVVLNLKSPREPGQDKLNIHFGRWYFNSIFIASWVTLLQLITSAMAAYAFSRLHWPGRDKVFLTYLSTMMIPGLMLMIPNYLIMVKLQLVNTYSGLIIPAAFSAFGTFLLRQFMLSIPTSLDEAAQMDGASPWQIFTEIILPLSRPGIITLAIFTFLGNYASFFWPLIMIKDSWLYTLPIGMLTFDSTFGRQTHLLMAAAVMNVAPLIVLFVLLQKHLVRGVQLKRP